MTSSWMQDEHSMNPATSQRITRLQGRCRVRLVSHIEEGTVLGAFRLNYHRLGPYEIPARFRPAFDLICGERGNADANHVCTVLVDGGVFVTTDFKLVRTAERERIPQVMRPTAFLRDRPSKDSPSC
jgi:hypothetical protein